MRAPPLPPDEAKRLSALRRLEVLDTPREERFDRICRLACAHFKVPVALVSLVDADRQWFKAAQGLDVAQTPRDVSFCGHAILTPEALVVEDAAADERFCDNPLVAAGPGIRFYAGQPLAAPDGSLVGTLCVIDRVPRKFGAAERESLRDLARMVERELNLAGEILALEAKREHEARYAAIVDGALDCVISMDEDGRIVDFNPAAERTFGYAKREVIGKSLAEHLIPQRLRDAHAGGLRHYLKTGEGPVMGRRVEVTAMRSDGTEFPIEMAITALISEGRHWFTAYLRDISERQMAMSRIALQYKIVKTLAESATVEEAVHEVIPAVCEAVGWELGAAWRADEGEDALRLCAIWRAEGLRAERFVEASRQMSFGRGIGLPGRVWRDDRPLWIRDVTLDEDFLRSATALEGGLRSAFAFPIRAGARAIGVVEFFSRQAREPDTELLRMMETVGSQLGEFSARKADEARLRELTAELDIIFNLSPDGFLAFGRDGRKRYSNSSFGRIFGVDQNALDGLPAQDVDDFLRSRCDPSSAYEPLASAADGETCMLRVAMPKPLTLKRSVKMIQEGADGPLRRVAYFRDVTIEDEVDRMKTEFLSTAAHELRTPMSSILGFAELLLKRDYDDATRRELLETIHRQSANLGRLIDELLDLARIEARAGKDFRIRHLPLFPLVRQTVAGLSVPGDGRRVSVRLPANSPQVAIDEDKFRQALLNVLSNAYKYSPGGGPIQVLARSRELDGARQVGIVVRDHGIGMTDEQLEHVFERFYRADTSGAIPGTGLGMSLVKEIVELHGGSVGLKSRPGKGTEVTLWFVQEEAAVQEAARA